LKSNCYIKYYLVILFNALSYIGLNSPWDYVENTPKKIWQPTFFFCWTCNPIDNNQSFIHKLESNLYHAPIKNGYKVNILKPLTYGTRRTFFYGWIKVKARILKALLNFSSFHLDFSSFNTKCAPLTNKYVNS